jgi:hypothetical protein
MYTHQQNQSCTIDLILRHCQFNPTRDNPDAGGSSWIKSTRLAWDLSDSPAIKRMKAEYVRLQLNKG